MGSEPGDLTVCLIVDYQNIHLTAHDLFAPRGTPVRGSLVDPLSFAEKVVEVRSARQQIPRQKTARLEAVNVFRGSPSNHREPGLYSAAQRQRAMWSRDPRVNVAYRTLRYPGNWGQSWCTDRPREKGIDVLVALDLVDQAQTGAFDIVILASHDTDMEPAVERAFRYRHARIETAGWYGARRLRPHGHNVWHTALGPEDFVATRDRHDYWTGTAGTRQRN